MSEDPPRLLDGDSELGRALRATQGDVLSPDAITRVKAGVSAKAAAPAAATSASMLSKLVVLAVVVGAGTAVYLAASKDEPTRPVSVATTAPILVAPSAAPEPTPIPAADQPAASATQVPAVVATDVPRSRPKPVASQPPADAVTREGAILLEARRLVETDPARALMLVKQCERDFPNSQLSPERERIATQAKQHLAP